MSHNRLSAQDLDLALSEFADIGDVEWVLNRHPLQQRDLAPLLHAASRARAHLSKVPPPPRGLQDGRRRLLAEAAQMRATRVRCFRLLPSLQNLWSWPQQLSPKLRFVVIVLLVLVKLTSVSGGVVLAAEQSLPGDLLYPVKEKVEDVRLSVARDPASLTLFYTERRLQDIDEAMQKGRTIPEPTVHRLECQFTYLLEHARTEADNANSTPGVGLAGHLRGQMETLDAIAAQMEGAAQQRLVEAKERVSRELDQAEGAMDHEPSSAPLVDDSHGTPRPEERDSAQKRPVSRPDPTHTPPVEQTQGRDARKDGDTDGQSALPTAAMPPQTDKTDKGQNDQITPGEIKQITPDTEVEETERRPPTLPSKAAPAAQDAVLGPPVTPGLPPKGVPPGPPDPPQPERPQAPIPPSNRGNPTDKDRKDEEGSVPPAVPLKEVPPVPAETPPSEEEDTTLTPTPVSEEPTDGDGRSGAPGAPTFLPPKQVPPAFLDKPQPTETPRSKQPPRGAKDQDADADDQVPDASEASQLAHPSPKSPSRGPESFSIPGRRIRSNLGLVPGTP